MRMYRQQSSRNYQRSKGIKKLRNVIQVCVVVVIGVWLLYQVKHSHDKKKEFQQQQQSNQSLHDLRSASRKDLTETIVAKSNSEGKGRFDEEEKELKDEIKKDQVVRREKSFKGDDVASEVAHSPPEEVEHEQMSHEAREKSFKGDDVSSAVKHEPVTDSELHTEELMDSDDRISEDVQGEEDVFDEATGNNEDLDEIEQFDETQHKVEKKEVGAVISEVQNNQSLSNATNSLKYKVDLKSQKADILGNQTSSNSSRNQETVSMNSTTISEIKEEARIDEEESLDLTTSVVSEQNKTLLSKPVQELNSEIKIESIQDDKSSHLGVLQSEVKSGEEEAEQ